MESEINDNVHIFWKCNLHCISSLLCLIDKFYIEGSNQVLKSNPVCMTDLVKGESENMVHPRQLKIYSEKSLRGYPNVLYPPRANMTERELYPLPWGEVYPHRAVAATWGGLCDRLIFVVDNQSSGVPDQIGPFPFIQLDIELPQSKKDRNIWEKSWKMWKYVGTHHLNDAEWFLKIDDDTFFSPINFKGFVRYLNPFQPYYLGHTLLHLWEKLNVVFNSGSCYALSKESLRRLTPIFSKPQFLYPDASRQERGTKCFCLCMHRRKAFEDPAMGVCLHSLGIDPINTMDEHLRERFSPLREQSVSSIKRKDDFWYWKWKHKNIKQGKDSITTYPISFHFYKDKPMTYFTQLHKKYNAPEGVNGKIFKPPLIKPQRFLHGALPFTIDQYRNTLNPPKDQEYFQDEVYFLVVSSDLNATISHANAVVITRIKMVKTV
ncbi:hypothetical protein RFI_14056 [Reticulomyxa filosa]|uniref:N-acetylgalactosaminide beta-1,3-galactosyltransferase n=1 Tax=Reticulomyxa filosa TaxID=46433 RepID=X6NA08_RETFI|nr:hypothetical protein RFI_14056 [Reticulomyxa filosa]|eukprot:ETO23130.1 hypothetical protein RFI_14056 [Reticulomyxa filosa]